MQDEYGAMLMKIIILGTNVAVVVSFLYEVCLTASYSGEQSDVLVKLSRKVCDRVLQYARLKVVVCVEEMCESMGVDATLLQLLIRLIDEAEATINEFTANCEDLMGFVQSLQSVTSARDAVDVLDAIWLVLIEMLGRDVVEAFVAEHAETLGRRVAENLKAVDAPQAMQMLSATLVEASVSFAAL